MLLRSRLPIMVMYQINRSTQARRVVRRVVAQSAQDAGPLLDLVPCDAMSLLHDNYTATNNRSSTQEHASFKVGHTVLQVLLKAARQYCVIEQSRTHQER